MFQPVQRVTVVVGPKVSPVRPPHGCRESDGSAEAFGFRCATPYSGAKFVPQQRLKALNPSLRSICELVLGPTYASVPTVTKTHDRNMTVCRPKSGGKYLHAVKIQDHKRTRVEILL